MTAATCHGCGVPLLPSKPCGPPRKWCGERCRKAKYAGACVDCGAPTNGSSGRAAAPKHCAAHNPGNASLHEQWAASRDARFREVQALWKAELPTREIAARMDTTAGGVRQLLHRMRRDGWDVPYRRPGVHPAQQETLT